MEPKPIRRAFSTRGAVPVVGAFLLLAACASPPGSGKAADPSGTYDVELWSGGRAHQGTLTVGRSEEGWTASAVFRSGREWQATLVTFEGASLRVTIESPEGLISISATLRGAALEGTWRSRSEAGLFRARRQGW